METLNVFLRQFEDYEPVTVTNDHMVCIILQNATNSSPTWKRRVYQQIAFFVKQTFGEEYRLSLRFIG
jgi:hypothetical protein